MNPVVGVAACVHPAPDGARHGVEEQYLAALRSAGVLPLLVAGMGPEDGLLKRLDGLLLPGSESNVAPALYGAGEDVTPGQHDPARDATVLPLVRAALACKMPVLAICRGHQELNVALGGSLHQAVHALPGRLDHRADPGLGAAQWNPAHAVALSGRLAAMLGRRAARVNSLHGQAIDRLGKGLVAEAVAPDGVIEGVRVEGAAFTLGVQWHPERGADPDGVGAALFSAFAAACRGYAGIDPQARLGVAQTHQRPEAFGNPSLKQMDPKG